MNYIDHIKNLNNFREEKHIPLMIDNKQVGYIRDDNRAYILSHSLFKEENGAIVIDKQFNTFESRNRVLDIFAKQAFADGKSNKYMNELYPIIETPTSKPLALVDRSVSTMLGLISFGQHLNGYVYKEGKMHMWIARRSYTKGYHAGKLDHIVAGGFPYGISAKDNLLKECDEEANIDEVLAREIKNVGFISYKHEYARGGKKDIVYCYDIELPQDFVPTCNDGEVEEFYLMPIEEVMSIVQNSNDFKDNCNLVLIDFFIRHGLIDSDFEDYIELGFGLKSF